MRPSEDDERISELARLSDITNSLSPTFSERVNEFLVLNSQVEERGSGSGSADNDNSGADVEYSQRSVREASSTVDDFLEHLQNIRTYFSDSDVHSSAGEPPPVEGTGERETRTSEGQGVQSNSADAPQQQRAPFGVSGGSASDSEVDIASIRRSIDAARSDLHEYFRTAPNVVESALGSQDASQQRANLGLTFHIVSSTSSAPPLPPPNLPLFRPNSTSAQSEQLRIMDLARRGMLRRRERAQQSTADSASTSLGRRVEARATAGSLGSRPPSAAAGNSDVSMPSDGLIGDLHVFIMPMPMPNDFVPGSTPPNDAARDQLQVQPQSEGVADRRGTTPPWDEGSRSPDELATRSFYGSVVSPPAREWDGEDDSSPAWIRRRRAMYRDYRDTVEQVEGRSYQIRRRLNADGDEYVHQIPRRTWVPLPRPSSTSTPAPHDARFSDWTRPVPPPRLSDERTSEAVNFARPSPPVGIPRNPFRDSVRGESLPFGYSQVDLPSTINNSTSNPISIRRRSGQFFIAVLRFCIDRVLFL
jgi:hypothetical protein